MRIIIIIIIIIRMFKNADFLRSYKRTIFDWPFASHYMNLFIS
jgi:hypothetical protein